MLGFVNGLDGISKNSANSLVLESIESTKDGIPANIEVTFP